MKEGLASDNHDHEGDTDEQQRPNHIEESVFDRSVDHSVESSLVES